MIVSGLPALEDLEAELELRELVSFIPRVSPKYMPPHHLAPLLHRLELAAEGIPQRVCCSAPPRHAKTESILHVPAFVLRRFPQKTLSYSGYGDKLARRGSRVSRRIVGRIGIETSGNVNEWRTPEGGGVLAHGVGGPLTGFGVDIALVDDPTKNRVEAESATYRERLIEWMRDVLMTRIEPGGSIFVFATRWHPDDLIGQLTQEGFEHINLPALGITIDGVRVPDEEHGEALWPERWPTAAMRRRLEEVGPYTAASLFQGQPRGRGDRVFGDVHTYAKLPGVYRAAAGTDSAYSQKKTADRSAVVRMVVRDGLYYVTFAKAMRVPAPAFKAYCRAIHVESPGMTWRWYAATSELGAGQFMAEGEDGIPLDCRIATADKFVRAIPFAAAWNAGKVLVPERAEWLEEFLTEMAAFTGVSDKRDDLVDAAVAAFDELVSGTGDDGPIGSPPPPEGNPWEGM